jgi:hypothetical protein
MKALYILIVTRIWITFKRKLMYVYVCILSKKSWLKNKNKLLKFCNRFLKDSPFGAVLEKKTPKNGFNRSFRRVRAGQEIVPRISEPKSVKSVKFLVFLFIFYFFLYRSRSTLSCLQSRSLSLPPLSVSCSHRDPHRYILSLSLSL